MVSSSRGQIRPKMLLNQQLLGFIFWVFILAQTLFVPTFAAAQISNSEILPQSIGGELGLPQGDIRVTIARIIRVAMSLIGIIMVVLVMYSGFLWMTAGGNDEQIVTAKKTLSAAIIGLAIILSAWSLTNFIIDQLVSATAGTGTP